MSAPVSRRFPDCGPLSPTDVPSKVCLGKARDVRRHRTPLGCAAPVPLVVGTSRRRQLDVPTSLLFGCALGRSREFTLTALRQGRDVTRRGLDDTTVDAVSRECLGSGQGELERVAHAQRHHSSMRCYALCSAPGAVRRLGLAQLEPSGGGQRRTRWVRPETFRGTHHSPNGRQSHQAMAPRSWRKCCSRQRGRPTR